MLNTTRIPALSLSICLLLLPGVGEAASVSRPGDWCGTDESLGEIAAARHRQLERRRGREASVLAKAGGPLIQAASKPQVSQEGDVVVMIDDGTLIQEPNASDASGKGYFFRKKKKKLKLTKKPGGISQNLGDRITLGDDDTLKLTFEKGFKFKFFGSTYTSAYVNSDGNITFGQGDSSSASRDLGRALNGPARVMAYFTDLDPSAGGEVYVNFLSKGKMQITWVDVPEFGAFNSNSFQVTLFKKGHVQIKFGDVAAQAGVVGISPGGGAAVELLDFSEEAPVSVPEQAIAELFGSERTVDEGAVARVFYDNYPDDVQQIVVFYDFTLPLLGGNAVAYHFSTKNDVKGIGYKNNRSSEIFDSSSTMGSNGVLEGFANMGYVHKYGDNLDRLRGTLSHLGVFIHEIGHQWLSRVYFRQNGATHTDLQEFGGHWSFNTHTAASFMQGNDIMDNGDGTFFTLETDASFSPTDLYMLGYLAPESVPDFFFVDNSGQDPGQLPQFNFPMFGQRVDVSIDDIIREEGPRVPSVDDSPKTQRLAMILLVPAGEEAQQRSIDKVQNFVNKGKKAWKNMTDNVGSMDFTLSPN